MDHEFDLTSNTGGNVNGTIDDHNLKTAIRPQT